MKIMLEPWAKMPTRAHPYDAGLDLYATEDIRVSGCCCDPFDPSCVTIGSAVIDTGVHIEIPEGYVGFIKSKSGLNVNHGLTAEGVIDAHYTGSIKVKLYNHTEYYYEFKAGEKIAQLVILPCLLPDLELVESMDETDRGDGGFGSTGK